MLSDFHKVIDRRAERAQVRFLLLHLLDPGQIGLLNLGSSLLLMIGQEMRCLIHERISALERRPQRRGRA